MTVIATMLAFAFVVSTCAACYHRNRAMNLQLCVDQLECELDDARREVAHVRHLHSTLLDENTTLVVDLMHTEKCLTYYRSAHRRSEPVRYIMAGALPKKEWKPL
jgi:hypothetical protein